MPKDFLFPSVAGVSRVITLNANRAFDSDLLGTMVNLDGFTLTIEDSDGDGFLVACGPGVLDGATNITLAAEQAVMIAVSDGAFKFIDSTIEQIQELVDHAASTQNPHSVTKDQVGLGNVDNTSDMDKPVSTAQQAAINNHTHSIDDFEGLGGIVGVGDPNGWTTTTAVVGGVVVTAAGDDMIVSGVVFPAEANGTYVLGFTGFTNGDFHISSANDLELGLWYWTIDKRVVGSLFSQVFFQSPMVVSLGLPSDVAIWAIVTPEVITFTPMVQGEAIGQPFYNGESWYKWNGASWDLEADRESIFEDLAPTVALAATALQPELVTEDTPTTKVYAAGSVLLDTIYGDIPDDYAEKWELGGAGRSRESFWQVSGNSRFVGFRAFKDCVNLTSLDIPFAEEVSAAAFLNCGIIYASLPSASHIGFAAFSGCSALSDAYFPQVLDYNQDALDDCPALSTLNLDSIKFITRDFFNWKPSLVSVSFASATQIDVEAFHGCSGLKSIHAPLVDVIGMRAFKLCSSLESVNFPRLTILDEDVFVGCINLRSAALPNLKEIWGAAFDGCVNLTTLYCSLESPNDTYDIGFTGSGLLYLHVTPTQSPGNTDPEWVAGYQTAGGKSITVYKDFVNSFEGLTPTVALAATALQPGDVVVTAGNATRFYLNPTETLADNLVLSASPPQSAETFAITPAITAPGNVFIEQFVTGPLGRTSIPAGVWSFKLFSTYINDLGAAGINSLKFRVNRREEIAGVSGTWSGSGAQRSFTFVGTLPAWLTEGNVDRLKAPLIETPGQTGWISAIAGNVLTVNITDSAYANPAAPVAVNAFYQLLFESHPTAINLTPSGIVLEADAGSTALQTFDTTRPAFACNPTDRIVVAFFANATAGTKRIKLYYGGTARYTNLETPLGSLANSAEIAHVPSGNLSGATVKAAIEELDARHGRMFYASEYGVKADGVTDDRLALQACIDAAAAVATPSVRSTVILPAGTIILTRATRSGAGPLPPGGLENPGSRPYWKFCTLLKNNVNVIGQGIDSTVLKIGNSVVEQTSGLFSDNLPVAMGGTDYSDNITLKHFTLDGNATVRGVETEGEGINIKTGRNVLIQSVRVKNAEQDGFDMDGGSDLALIDCIAEDCLGSGIHGMSGGIDRILISNCVVKRNGYTRRVQEQKSFVGSISGTTLTVTSVTSGVVVGIGLIHGSGITPGTTISAFGTAGTSGTGGVGTYAVNNSQTISSISMVSQPYRDLGTGIDLLANYAIVSNCICENNAVELHVLGGSAVVEGCVFKHNPTSLGLAAIVTGWAYYPPITTASLEMRNCKIYNNSANTRAFDSVVEWPRLIVEGCEILGKIVFSSIKNLIITGNYITPGGGSYDAMHIALATGKVDIKGNFFEQYANGIKIDNAVGGTIANNTFYAPTVGSSDLHLTNSGAADNWQIVDNVFAATSTPAIRLNYGQSGMIVKNNVANTTAGFAILLAGACANGIYSGNHFSTVSFGSSSDSGNVFTDNIISGTITHNTTANFSINTWRRNTGAGCEGIFYGTATLASGTATVTTAAANSARKFGLTRQAPNASTAIGNLALGTITAQTSFVINSLNDSAANATGDASSVYWEILE